MSDLLLTLSSFSFPLISSFSVFILSSQSAFFVLFWVAIILRNEVKILCWPFTVNSRYCGHPRDRGLVSVMARVRNYGVREKLNFLMLEELHLLMSLQNQLQCSFRISRALELNIFTETKTNRDRTELASPFRSPQQSLKLMQ